MISRNFGTKDFRYRHYRKPPKEEMHDKQRTAGEASWIFSSGPMGVLASVEWGIFWEADVLFSASHSL